MKEKCAVKINNSIFTYPIYSLKNKSENNKLNELGDSKMPHVLTNDVTGNVFIGLFRRNLKSGSAT